MKDFIDYAASVLGPKEIRQFKKAIEKPATEFHTRVIAPQFYQPSCRRYIGLSTDHWLAGRNHSIARNMLEEPNAWHALTYFTNPLSIPPPPDFREGKEHWVAPKDRIVWGSSQVFTFEFDKNDLGFLSDQLRWCRSRTGKFLDCPIGDLYRHCSRWVDFEGITVNYSGNKSLHIHVVFNTAFAQNLGIHENLRTGICAHWDKLRIEVLAILKPGIDADASLRAPEQFRRIPNGFRKLDKPNILGIPAGVYVPQVTLWEQFRDRASKGATAMFFDPTLFVRSAPAAKSSSREQATPLPIGGSLDFCRDKMREIFNANTFPAFHDFVEHQGSVRATFFNHAGDCTPSSFMNFDYRTVLINGANPLNLTSTTMPRLPRPLGEMMDQWSDEFELLNNRVRSPVEQAFAHAAVDKDAARKEISRLLLDVIRRERLALICAPEGITKTTGLFTNHARIDRWLKAENDGTVMYAFPDYKTAKEKAEEFNERQVGGRHRGVVIESFDRAYKLACEELGIDRLSSQEISDSGFHSRWSAIEAIQPQVIEKFRERHAKLWDEVGDASPVFFTVHAVAHNWPLTSRTRTMWAPSFWDAQNRNDSHSILVEETKLSMLIHDEVTKDDLVAAYPASKVRWVASLLRTYPQVWRENRAALDRAESFKKHSALDPLEEGITFEEVQDIAAFQGHEWDQVTTRDSGEYGKPKHKYADAIGKEWCILDRRWPVDTAPKTLVLTTEAVPLEVAKVSIHDWTIIDLDTPLIGKDEVEVHPLRGVVGKKLAKLCTKWQKNDPDIFVVSNKVAHLPDTMTHAKARGSNRLVGRRILQTMTFITPSEFEKLEALNAWTGLNCLIRKRHIDEFNQTAGRNLGFRKQEGATHTLLVNIGLFPLLNGAPLARCRYRMEVNLTAHRKRLSTAPISPSKLKMQNLKHRLRQDRAHDDADPILRMAA